jgi:hypothetical protein
MMLTRSTYRPLACGSRTAGRPARRLLTLLLLLPSAAGASALTIQPHAAEDDPAGLLGLALSPATEAAPDDASGSPDGIDDFAGHLASGLAKRPHPGPAQPPDPAPGSAADRFGAQARLSPGAAWPAAAPGGIPGVTPLAVRPGHHALLVQQAMLGAARHPSLAFMFDPVFRPGHDHSYLATGNAAGFADFFVLGRRDEPSMTLLTYGGHSGGFLEATVAANPLPEPQWTPEQGYRGLAGPAETHAPRTGSLILMFLDRYVWSVVAHPLTLGAFGVAALLWAFSSARQRTAGRRRA